jgi:hypothetical protein
MTWQLTDCWLNWNILEFLLLYNWKKIYSLLAFEVKAITLNSHFFQPSLQNRVWVRVHPNYWKEISTLPPSLHQIATHFGEKKPWKYLKCLVSTSNNWTKHWIHKMDNEVFRWHQLLLSGGWALYINIFLNRELRALCSDRSHCMAPQSSISQALKSHCIIGTVCPLTKSVSHHIKITAIDRFSGQHGSAL